MLAGQTCERRPVPEVFSASHVWIVDASLVRAEATHQDSLLVQRRAVNADAGGLFDTASGIELKRDQDSDTRLTVVDRVQDASKVYLCNAAFPRQLNASFAALLNKQRAPALAALVTCAALPEAREMKGMLRPASTTCLSSTA